MLRLARPETPDERYQLNLLAIAPDYGRELTRTVARPVDPGASFVIGDPVYRLSHLGHMVAGMCNDYRSHVDLNTIRQDFSEIRIRIRFPEGAPNLQPRDDIRITETAAIVRADGEPGIADLVQRRWSWPERGRPVYNFRSENREFTSGRGLIVGRRLL